MSDSTLSTIAGQRLAKVKDGKMNKKTIYLYNPSYKCCRHHDKKCRGDCCDKCCEYYYHVDDVEKNVKYCKLSDDGVFSLLPTDLKGQTDVIFLCGERGCGKSTTIASYLEEFIKIHKNQKIFLFSQKKNDDNLDEFIDKRIDLNTYVDKGCLTLEDFKNPCVTIFDDIDCLTNTKENSNLKEKIYSLMNSLIQIGRSQGITVIQTAHLARDHEVTKHVLNGCSRFIFFSNAVTQQIKDALKLYLGLSTEQIKLITNLKNTNHVTVIKTSPRVILTEKEIFILQ